MFYESLKWNTDFIFRNFYDNKSIALFGDIQWHLDCDKWVWTLTLLFNSYVILSTFLNLFKPLFSYIENGYCIILYRFWKPNGIIKIKSFIYCKLYIYIYITLFMLYIIYHAIYTTYIWLYIYKYITIWQKGFALFNYGILIHSWVMKEP